MRFTVYGTPAPQGSKTAVQRGGRAILIEGSSSAGRAKHRAWRQAVTADALAARGPDRTCFDGPVHVTLEYAMRKPASKPKRLAWCPVKPDLDKLIRATLDGLADAGVVPHDQRVVSVLARKRYAPDNGPTGCWVEIREAGEVGMCRLGMPGKNTGACNDV